MAISVSGRNPTKVTVVSNTVTTDTIFNGSATNNRTYVIQDDDIAGTINDGIVVGGFGLWLETNKAGGSIAMVNNGGVTVDRTSTALQLVGNGGTMTYSGTGFVTNHGGKALNISNIGAGSIGATISDNITANDTQAITVGTDSGAVSFTQNAGTTTSNGVGSGDDAIIITTTSGNIVANLNGTIFGDQGAALFDSTSGDITVNFTGSISTNVRDGVAITSQGAITLNSSGNFFVNDEAIEAGDGSGSVSINVTGGQIHAGDTGIIASAGTGGALVDMSGGRIGTAAQRVGNTGIFAEVVGTTGDLTITSAAIFANNHGIDATMAAGATGDLTVTANGTTSGLVGNGITVENIGTGTTIVTVNAAVSGVDGVTDFGGATTVTNNGSITGTSGTAVHLGAGNDIYNGVAGLVSGAVSGGAGNDTLRSGAGNNTLNGGADHDILDGGIGADSMIGGTGNDVFYVNDALDIVTELAGEGTDEVRTSLGSYSIASLANVENLTGTSSGQTLTGNAGVNVITGGTGNDTLDGGGGGDTMIGGLGNDTYIVDSATDTVTEALNQGTDEVRAALATYTLAANVENLTGTANTGQTLTGNTLANVINGGTGNDTIDGGAGIDSAVFAGQRSQYTLTALAGGSVQVVGADGTDTLSNVERLVFDDQALNWANPSMPSAAIADHDVKVNQYAPLGSWLSYAGADGRPAAVQYQFLDAGTAANSGYFWTADVGQRAANEYITINAADLATTWVRGGQVAGSETMWVRGFDGFAWSDWDAFTLTTEVNTAPVATINNQGVHNNEWTTVQGLLSASDADGDAITRYQFYELGHSDGQRLFLDRRRRPARGQRVHHDQCRRSRHHLGARRVGVRQRNDVGARLRRHRLGRLGRVHLHDGEQRAGRHDRPSDSARQRVGRGAELRQRQRRRRRCHHPVSVP